MFLTSEIFLFILIICQSGLSRRFLSFVGPVKRSSSYGDAKSDILFETIGKCGIITLNRPSALNAFNIPMVLSIIERLDSWENTMSMILIRGIGRAFCAGGDLRTLTSGGIGNPAFGKEFLRASYSMNYKIGTCRLPYIALIDGITLGGGVGLGCHGRYCVATERTRIGMPEVSIGFFPDVGSSYLLPRLPYHFGMYMGLTGIHLSGLDAKKIGIATHYCNSENIPILFEALVETQGDVKFIEETLNEFSIDTKDMPFTFGDKLESIDNIFSLPSVEDIMTALAEENTPWAKETLELMKTKCPSSLKITHREYTLGQRNELHECLKMEYRLGVAILESRISDDLYEGVRAILVDKDKNPIWNPNKLENITEAMIQNVFSMLTQPEELDVNEFSKQMS